MTVKSHPGIIKTHLFHQMIDFPASDVRRIGNYHIKVSFYLFKQITLYQIRLNPQTLPVFFRDLKRFPGKIRSRSFRARTTVKKT